MTQIINSYRYSVRSSSGHLFLLHACTLVRDIPSFYMILYDAMFYEPQWAMLFFSAGHFNRPAVGSAVKTD